MVNYIEVSDPTLLILLYSKSSSIQPEFSESRHSVVIVNMLPKCKFTYCTVSNHLLICILSSQEVGFVLSSKEIFLICCLNT